MSIIWETLNGVNSVGNIIIDQPMSPFRVIIDAITFQGIPRSGKEGQYVDAKGNILFSTEESKTDSYSLSSRAVLLIITVIFIVLVIPTWFIFSAFALAIMLKRYRERRATKKEVVLNTVIGPIFIVDLIIRQILWRYY